MTSRAIRREARIDEILSATLEALEEHGLGMSVVDVGRRIGMTAAHILYYFPTRELLLIAAMRRHQDQMIDEISASVERVADPFARLRLLIERGLPRGAADPYWMLWVEGWARASRDSDMAASQFAFEMSYRRLLLDGLNYAQERLTDGEYDLAELATRLSALIDGLGLQVAAGSPVLSRDMAIAMCLSAVVEARPFIDIDSIKAR